MKILSFNVGIWTRNRKKEDKFYWKERMVGMKKMIEDINPEVICFQELWWPATRYIPKCYRKACGTGLEHPIYVKKGLKTGLGIFSIHWSEVRVEGVRIFSIHGHWDDKKTERLCDNVRRIYARDLKPSVLAGDWNKEYADLYKQTQLLHSARVAKRLKKEDTYIHFYDSTRHGELDHFLLYRLIPQSFKIVYGDYGVNCGRLSDHYPIVLEIK